MVRTSGASPVCLVHLVSLMQPNKPDRPKRPNEQDGLADFFSTLLEQAGGVLILQFLAKVDQFLLEGQKPVTDRVRQVAVVHGGIG